MNTCKWHSGPPPHIGWWNASLLELISVWRWWDGTAWSDFVSEDKNAATAANRAKQKISRGDANIKWTDYWPEKARVPRIDPRKAK